MVLLNLFIGQPRQPSDLVARRLTVEPERRAGLTTLLGEQSLHDAYVAFDESPEDDTDCLTPELHSYFSTLLRDEYSAPPEGLQYFMANDEYILGQPIGDYETQVKKLNHSQYEEASERVAQLLGVRTQELSLYALVW